FSFTADEPLGPQILTLVAGGLVSVLAFLLTVEVARAMMVDKKTGESRYAIIAGLIVWAIVTVCGQLIQSSFVIMADAPGLLWATLSAWALVVYGRTRRPFWIALSAFALAWATMTRWQYGSLAVVWSCVVIGYHLPISGKRKMSPTDSPSPNSGRGA